MINSSFYFIRNPIFSVAENRDFGRFVTTWYSVHCKHTRFFEFLGLLNEFFLEEAWFWGVRVGFGGREGALASALIKAKYRAVMKRVLCFLERRYFNLIFNNPLKD